MSHSEPDTTCDHNSEEIIFGLPFLLCLKSALRSSVLQINTNSRGKKINKGRNKHKTRNNMSSSIDTASASAAASAPSSSRSNSQSSADNVANDFSTTNSNDHSTETSDAASSSTYRTESTNTKSFGATDTKTNDTEKQSGDTSGSKKDDSMFECNICLDTAKEAVVSMCGHLFCWPCLHQWLETRPTRQLCPVCKAAISKDKVIPLYGRGSTKEEDPRYVVMLWFSPYSVVIALFHCH